MKCRNKSIDRATLDELMEGLMAKKEKHDDTKEDIALIKKMVKSKDLKKPAKKK